MSGKPGTRWPADKVIRLHELEAEGVSIREMARRMGCSEDTIFRQRVHAGMPRRPPPIAPRTEPRPPKRVRQGTSTLPQLASLAGDEP
jgi:transposase-like protein